MMWEKIVEALISHGIFAALFGFLLFHQVKDGRRREIKYQEIIKTLNLRLSAVETIKADVDKIVKTIASKPAARKN